MTEELWVLVEDRAPNTPGKDRSGYITNLVEEDLRQAGLIPGNERAEINAAIDEIGEGQALEILRRASRRKGAQVRTIAA